MMPQEETKEKTLLISRFSFLLGSMGFAVPCLRPAERVKLIAKKAQMEQQIQTVEEQIFLEEIKLLSRNYSPGQHTFKALR